VIDGEYLVRERRPHVRLSLETADWGRPTETKMSLEKSIEKASDEGWGETAKIIVQALAIALLVRVFFYQPFNIPSGSMKETLLVGDYIFVSKLSYGLSRYSFPRTLNICVPLTGWCTGDFRILPDLVAKDQRIFGAEPKRGDVVVFRLPRDPSIDYIKRLVGLPGDKVQTKDSVLYINDTAVPKVADGSFDNIDCHEGYSCEDRHYQKFKETLPNGVSHATLELVNSDADNRGPYTVPDGHYFMMGDNRDNSIDSRFLRSEGGVGFVPYENLIGRADVIFYSCESEVAGTCNWIKPWYWPVEIRWSRLFKAVR
jgi:signal peptidase I